MEARLSGAETVRISSIASGGDGVGRLGDGRAVFVPRTAPGDLVELADVRRSKAFARAAVGRVVEASPDRATPACRHVVDDDCGGCVLQHLAPEAQLRAKSRIVRDSLERIAKLPVGDVEIVANPRPWGWRTRLALSVDARTGDVGFRRLARPDATFALVRCEIASPALQALWDALRPLLELRPRRAERITLRQDATGGLHVMAHGCGAWSRAAEVAAALDAAGVPATLWIQPEGDAARAVAGPAPKVSATVFEQVDPAMGDVVRAHALSVLGDVAGRRVWDLYAGTGETTSRLAAAGAVVESVEWDHDAVEAAERRGPADVVRHVGRVEDVIPELAPADAAIVNPPRSGLGPEVTDALLARPPAQLAYVSCDPATLARDLARMSSAYRLVSVRAFDSFPQTAHVETVVALRNRG